MTDPKVQTKARVSLWVKIQTCLLAGVLVLLAILVVVAVLTARRVGQSLDLVQSDLQSLEMDHINEAIDAS